MEWLSRLNTAIEYLEGHLEDEIDLTRMAQIACCSPFHFQRMFSYLAEVPLGEYIRRRRMTRAVADLQNENNRIMDIALKYGYDSPTAFNRAFQSVHGIAPSEARKPGVMLNAYLPISFKITIKGEAQMNYRIEKRDAFQIVGVKLECPWTPEKQEGFTEVPKFWAKHGQKGTIPELCKLINQAPMGVLGVSVGDWQTAGSFDYYIAVSSSQPAPDGMFAYEVPASTWAIFECRGAMPTAIQTLQKRIVTEWLPSSGYEYANAPDIEVYFEGDQQAEDYRCEVWLPVAKTR